MRYTKLLLPTLREIPAEADVISHQLMLRAGMIRKLAAGVYSLLPLGYRVIRKFEDIVRKEMNKSGAQEVHLSVLAPAELWQESGRWNLYGKELMRIKDRHNHDFCLGPTHEEIITDMVRKEVRSYKELPLNLYQIQTKFRDEIRPRFGLMRGREFIMKDAYSFDKDSSGTKKTYEMIYEAYCQIFKSCSLKFKAVEADTGNIGGNSSHEFMVLANTGEDIIASCSKCNYAANIELAEVKIKDNEHNCTPLNLEKVYTPDKKSVEEVTKFLKISAQQLVKTIIFSVDDRFAAVLVRGDHEVNEAKLQKILNAESISLASEENISTLTKAPQGFSGPIGIDDVTIIADNQIKDMFNFVVGANEKDYHYLNANHGRDFNVDDFADIRFIVDSDLCPKCYNPIELIRGIEVGHVFQLGTKYSKKLKATFLDEHGQAQPFDMGCYGIGIGRTVAAAIEQNHDQHGIIWPLPLAPFEIIILPLNTNNSEVIKYAESFYTELINRGVDVLLDDRTERAGVKFKDADLIGIPIQLIIGERALKNSKVEIKIRKTQKRLEVELTATISKIIEIRDQLTID